MKKSTKSRLCLILSIVMLFALMGCSEGSDPSEERTSRSTREQTEESEAEKEEKEGSEKTTPDEDESEVSEVEEENEEPPIETTRPPLLPTETKETEKEPSGTTKDTTPTKKTTPGKKTTPTKAPTKKATPTKKGTPTKTPTRKVTPTKNATPTKKPTATPVPAKLTKETVQKLVDKLVEDMASNNYEAVNKRAGCEVMSDYGTNKDFLPLFYKYCTYKVSISNATTTSCDVTIHFTYPEMGEAYEKAMAQPDKMKPVFWDFLKSVINNEKTAPVNVNILAEEMEPFMSSATKKTVDIKTKCTKKDKQYLFDGNIGALTMGFKPVFKWGGDGKLPENIALPIAEDLLKAGMIQHQEYYDWYVLIYKGEFTTFTTSIPSGSIIKQVSDFEYYAFDHYCWLPGVPVKTNNIGFRYVFKEQVKEDMELVFVYKHKGKTIFTSERKVTAGWFSYCTGIYKLDLSKLYASGKYQVVAYLKSDQKNPICTVEFTLP